MPMIFLQNLKGRFHLTYRGEEQYLYVGSQRVVILPCTSFKLGKVSDQMQGWIDIARNQQKVFPGPFQ